MEETRFAAAEIACGLLRAERDKLQKQNDLLVLGLLQEKNKVAALNKKVIAQKAYIEELETHEVGRNEK